MRALVIGASGQVGAVLSEVLAARGHAVAGTHHGHPDPRTTALDLRDLAAVEKLVEASAADWVFCPAGMTAVDRCEDEPDEARLLNCDGPAAAARAAARRDAGFVFWSTEYVFDGTAGPYREDAPTRAISVYGQSKLDGEGAVRAANPRSIVVRTTVVYGPDPQEKNFVHALLRAGRAGTSMRVVTDQVSSPTYAPDLAAAAVELAELGFTGVIHLAGDAVVSRLDFARVVCEVFGLDPGLLVPVTTAELNQRAPRPLRAGLAIDRARGLLKTQLRGPRAGLAAMRQALEAAAAAAWPRPAGRRAGETR
jgi:dTDP-4-dehydrorhamnose reductase